MADTPNTYPHFRWYNSLIVRVMMLCAVLVMCLLGSVYEITRHYFHEVVQEMETQAQDIANRIVLQLEEHPETDLRDIEERISKTYDGTRVNLDPDAGTVEINQFFLERDEKGQLVKVARSPITFGGRHLMVTTRVSIVPQTEIVRAFKNKYIALLTGVFVVTLCLMVYFIARILRPLSDLSETCAKISSGSLQDVSTGHATGEVLALEYTFNKMVASLREKEIVEANLRQAQRLSAIGNLAAGVAHDVRNPLNAIKLLSSHAIDTLGNGPDTAPAIKQLKTIRNEVNRLEDIVSGFLSLAKERELRPEPCSVDALLEDCARLVRKDAEARGIRVVTELRADKRTLLIDPKQMTRAILNVLINGMEACPRGGRLRLFSRLTDSTCEIEVRDDGLGMPKDVAERAFEPYFTTKTTGTGLGLSITRGIVEEHGGTMSLMSVEEQGCQVIIVLPLEPKSV